MYEFFFSSGFLSKFIAFKIDIKMFLATFDITNE